MQQRNSELAVLARASFAEWGGRVAVNWIEIAAIYSVAAHFDHLLGYLVAVLLLGTRQHALAILGHDGAHRSASHNRKFNDLATSILVLWPLGVGLDGYRRFHFLHHRWSGGKEDPELQHKGCAPDEWARPLSRRRMAWLIARDLCGVAIRDIFRLIKIVKPVSLADRVGPLLWWTSAILLAYRFGALWAIAVWWLATISSYWAVFRMRAWTEHFDTANTYRISATWWQKALFLPHNTWCHFEHHKWPGVPCWNLAKARKLDTVTPIVPVGELLQSFGEPRDEPSHQAAGV